MKETILWGSWKGGKETLFFPRPLDLRLCLFARIPRESRKIALGDKRTGGFSWDG